MNKIKRANMRREGTKRALPMYGPEYKCMEIQWIDGAYTYDITFWDNVVISDGLTPSYDHRLEDIEIQEIISKYWEDVDAWAVDALREPDQHPVDAAWQRLYAWQHHTGEFEMGGGCTDSDQTIQAWQLMGRLTVLGQLVAGAPFDTLVENTLQEVKELIEGEDSEH